MRRDKSRRRRGLSRPKARYRLKGFLSIFILSISIAAFMSSALFAEDRVAEGARDVAKGVSAVPSKVAERSNEYNILYGITVGTAEGLLDTAKGIGEGIFKILTFYHQGE